MQHDPFAQFKAVQKESWGLFAPMELFTTPPAFSLVDFAGVRADQKILDVGCGTGVVAVTAARRGAEVQGLDLSPALLERARLNAEIAAVKIGFTEGDAEALPYSDNSFDVVLSQFGHMFAPRPHVAMGEMLRVLKPGGLIAFSTWPAVLFTGKMFSLVAQYIPPPEGIAPPVQWGDPAIVRERLGDRVTDVAFNMDTLISPVLSPAHLRRTFETNVGPVAKFVEKYKDDNATLKKFRAELEALITSFTRGNTVHQQFLLTRAKKSCFEETRGRI